MKTIWKSLFIFALGAFAFSSCEDAPEPYSTPGEETGDEVTTPTEPAGSGTLADPYNCIAANEYIATLASGENSPENIYIKGKVVSIKENFNAGYGNATFYISEDGKNKNTFYVYRAFYLGNVKYTSGDLLEVGDEVIICGKVTNYNGTYETVQNGAYVYSINGNAGDGGGEEVGEATGDGTLENPFNSVAANNYASSLAADVNSENDVYIKGKVVSITENFDNSYGNATFYISDNGEAAGQFLAYHVYYLGNKKYTSGSGDLLKVGDEVVIYGKVVNFRGNTPETASGKAYIYSLNGKTEDGNQEENPDPVGGATGDGTLENPFNSVAATNYAISLGANVNSENDVYIKGKVVSVKENYDNSFGNATFYISDDGTSTNEFCVYRAYYLNNEKYTSGDLLQPGDDVIVCGKVVNYMGNTPETVQGQAYLYSLTSNGGGSGDNNGGGSGDNPGGEVSGNSITLTPSSLGLANGEEIGTRTLVDGTTLTFDGGGNTNVPKYYNTGTNFRMYPKNSMTVKSSKTISSIVINFDEASGTIYNASGDISATPGSVNVSETVATISNINSTTTTITNTSATTGAASQIRIVSITINYAE